MERFAFKIDKTLKANLYKICRLCGIDNPDKVNILGNSENSISEHGNEPELWRKIQICIGVTISKDDNMPQTMCTLCVDKVNDFFEFREMCLVTTAQTRKLLGLKEEVSLADDIKSESDVNNPLPSNNAKRAMFDKRRRKRNCADTFAKVDMEDGDFKIEKSTSSSIEIKKKMRLSHLNNNTNADPLTFGKRKPLKLMERRALALSKTKLKPKLEIKKEFSDGSSINQMNSCDNASEISPKLKNLKKCCTICGQRFISKAQLERHLSLIHVPNIPRYVCIACNETIKKGNEIKDHQLWHKLSKTPFICGLCGQSFLTGYSYSKHLRDHTVAVPIDRLVLDRECPQCHETFVTNFLYNIHSCSINTKRCGGCDRIHKTESDNLRHAASCREIYVNYSKHITPAAVSGESTVRIKNENDVEAAAEVSGHSANTALNMTPIVSLTRLSTSVVMGANQCVAIPGNITLSEDKVSPVKALKKPSKKSVTRKDLKRVDDLLKSTMDTFVSIKHEPEVHMDTDLHSDAESYLTDNDHAVEDASLCNGVKIKQEQCTDVEENHYTNIVANIKKELSDDAPNVERVPVLKLKITKEHGKLNSSIVDDNTRSEKKKKKKKRKDSERDKDRDMNENQNMKYEHTRENTIVMPQPGLICIKQEPEEDTNLMECVSHTEDTQFSRLVMTAIPNQMEFKIARISGGVDFSESLSTSTEHLSTSTQSNDLNENELPDIKPCRAELDRLLKITNTTGDVDMEQRQPNPVSDSTAENNGLKFKNSTDVEEHSRFPHTRLPQIVSVCSGKDVRSFVGLTNMRVKQERFDDSYGDGTQMNGSLQWNTEPFRNTDGAPDYEEENNISDVDYISINMNIKQEQEIDVSEMECCPSTNPSQTAEDSSKELDHQRDKPINMSIKDNISNKKSDDLNDDEMAGTEEEDNSSEPDSSEVEREYRELEIPPLMNESQLDSCPNTESNEVANNNNNKSIEFEKESINHGETGGSDLNCDTYKSDQPKTLNNAETSSCSMVKHKVTEIKRTEESISGIIIEDADVSLTAQPFSDPELVINNDLEDNASRSEEELQNHLNHEVNQNECETSAITPTSSLNSSNSTTLQNMEDIAVSSQSSSETAISMDLPTSSGEVVVPIESGNANEETENLINESAVLQRRIPIERNNSHFIIDDSNINEIAENNNNANIERELLDDNLTRTLESADHHEDMS